MCITLNEILSENLIEHRKLQLQFLSTHNCFQNK